MNFDSYDDFNQNNLCFTQSAVQITQDKYFLESLTPEIYNLLLHASKWHLKL